jgi:hypothetical protein
MSVIRVLVSLLAAAVIAGGCDFGNLPSGDALFVSKVKANEDGVTPQSEAARTGPVPYTVLYETPDLKRALYEPSAGCYTGALLSPEVNLREYNRDFAHEVYVADYDADGEEPAEFMLSCVAAQATPMLIIRPPEEGGLISQMYEAADWLGGYNLPVFVALMPVEPDIKFTADEYRVYYREARSLFERLAPMAAVVWLADFETENLHEYYPGDDAVDWVGLTCRSGYENGAPTGDIIRELDEFYMRYQEEKPVMLCPFGIGYFSDLDYKYYIDEAADELRRVYQTVRDKYPRVKLMAVTDVNLIGSGGHFNYSFSQNDLLADAYVEAVDDEYFNVALNERGEDSLHGWLRGGETAYFLDGRPFIGAKDASARSFRADHDKRILYVYN